jgi:nucleoside-diphosphate-sugar epimerase
MMILVTGGAGGMGKRLVRALAARGNQVRVLTLPGDRAAERLRGPLVEVCFGDVSDPSTLSQIMPGVTTVFHLAAILLASGREELFWKINYQGTRNLVSLGEASAVEHFIYVSSASILYPRSNKYARSKLAGEGAVINSRIPHYTIIRPTLAYEDGGAQEFVYFAEYLKRYPLVPFIGNGRALKTPVFVEDIINGLANIPGNPKSYGKTYYFSGSEEIPIRRLAELLLDHMGKKKQIIPIPVFLCRIICVAASALARITGNPSLLTWQTISGITQDLNPDNREAREDLYFNPRPFREGMQELRGLKDCLLRTVSK